VISLIRSVWTWTATAGLILFWTPLLFLIRLSDADPVRYRTGRWFRRLGAAMVRANPSWRLDRQGAVITDPRRPYVVVCNHQSLADIPLISCLPWEMKWLAKAELFRLPFVGWMMTMAGDIPVERGDRTKAATALLRAKWYLERRCSVMFFPEGTRSPDGRIHAFTEGAFRLAIRQQAPVLPLAIDGSAGCLPKSRWTFGPPARIRLAVLPPVDTAGSTPDDAGRLSEDVRARIIRTVAQWRTVDPRTVDGLQPSAGVAAR